MRSARKARSGRRSSASRYAAAIVRARWLVVIGWLAVIAAAVLLLPPPGGGARLGDLLPSHSPALTAQARSLSSFNVPITTGTVLVLHNPRGLSPLTTADMVLYAASIDQRLVQEHAPYPTDRVIGALPIVNPQDRTSAITFLYFSPSASGSEQRRQAEQYARHFRTDPQVHTYLTGLIPSENAQARYLSDSLLLVEAATLSLVLILVAWTFRSLLAPLLTVGAAGLAFLADERLLGWLARVAGLSFPSQLTPLVVALLLGVVTDYSVFFLSDLRDRLSVGDSPARAIQTTITDNAPIVAVAGVTVAIGCAALTVAPMKLFRAFGPGLAITVLVGAVTAVTVIPATLALLGRTVFWPTHPARRTGGQRRLTGRLARAISHRGWAAVAAAGCLLVLIAAALPVGGLKLSTSFSATLPASSTVQQGIAAMTMSFPRGVTAPTEMLIEGHDLSSQRTALGALQRQVARQPGVAAVYGPADSPLPGSHGVVISSDGRTARVVVIFAQDPLGASAIDRLRALQRNGPALAATAGLRHVHLAYAGGTPIASEVTANTMKNLKVVLAAAFGVELLLLAGYLRSAVTPVITLACSGMTVAASLGLTVLVFQDHLKLSGLTFDVPFAAAVLLVSLGSDYTVFGVGRIWQDAAHLPLSRAIETALPKSSRAITIAGITLAGSFALVALVPLRTFAELGFAVAAGLLLDTFLVRSVLVPSLLTLIGPASGWPGSRLRHTKRPGTPDTAVMPPEITDAPMPHTGRVRPRQLRRLILEVLTGVVILAAIGWGLDWAARVSAESLIARSIQHSAHLRDRPEVHIRGWFFLPQVVTGNYPRVDLTAHHLQAGDLRVATVTARARGVHVSLHDIVTDQLPNVFIDNTRETAEFTYADLNRYLRSRGTAVTTAYKPTGHLEITGHTTILGKQLSASADADARAIPGYLEITPIQLDTGTVLDAGTRLVLRQRLSVEIPTSPLPFGQHVTAIDPTAAGLRVSANGHDLLIPANPAG